MKRYFCDHCGREIKKPINVVIKSKTTKKRKTIMHLCEADAKYVKRMVYSPFKNIRARNIPDFYTVHLYDTDARKTTGLYMITEWNLKQLLSYKKDSIPLIQADGRRYYTIEEVRTAIENDKYACLEFCRLLFNKQTPDEKKNYETKHHNNEGFNKSDAKWLSAMAKLSFDKNNDAVSDEQLKIIIKRMKKYAAQIAALLNE